MRRRTRCLKMSPSLDVALCAPSHSLLVLRLRLFETWIPSDSMRLPRGSPPTLQDGLGFFWSCFLGSNPHSTQITSIKLTLSSLCSRLTQMLRHPPVQSITLCLRTPAKPGLREAGWRQPLPYFRFSFLPLACSQMLFNSG